MEKVVFCARQCYSGGWYVIGGVALKETCEANGGVKRNDGIGDMEKVVVVQGSVVVGLVCVGW